MASERRRAFSESSAMIAVEQLSKRYGTHQALDSVSFSAQPGEILGLLGPNGAGKTTTMRILTGFMPPTGGRAQVAGYDVVRDSMAVRQRVGYMPERIPLYPDMTVAGYVRFWAKLRGVSQPDDAVQRVLAQVQLDHRARSLVRSLSKGMKQRLGLAQALVHDPEVVILDEPTIGIDPRQVIEVRQAVRALAQDHTVLFSTHILSEAEQVCDRVVIINQGRLVAQGTPDVLRHQLQTGTRLFVMLDADPTQAESLLRGVPGVRHVEAQAGGWVLYVTDGVDARPQVVKRSTGAGFALLELRPLAMTLEDIFLDLVARDGSTREEA